MKLLASIFFLGQILSPPATNWGDDSAIRNHLESKMTIPAKTKHLQAALKPWYLHTINLFDTTSSAQVVPSSFTPVRAKHFILGEEGKHSNEKLHSTSIYIVSK